MHAAGIALLLLASAGSGPGPAVIPTVAGSSSPVLSASLIFSVQLVQVGPLEPPKSGTSGLASFVSTRSSSARIFEVLKGAVLPPPGADFTLVTSHYRGPIRSLPMEATGVFSLADLAAGDRWTVFCNPQGSEAPRASDLLAGLTPQCRYACRWESVHTDLDLIARVERSHLDLIEAVRLAGEHAPALSALLPRYLLTRSEVWRKGDEPQLEGLLELMERPELSIDARVALQADLYVQLTDHDGLPQASEEGRAALIRAELRLVGLPARSPYEAEFLRNLLGTYLPNDLGLVSALQKRKASAIFHGHPRELAAARVALRARLPGKDAARLLRWLDGGEGAKKW